MSVRKLNPITPGSRHRIAPRFDDVTTNKPEKSLLDVIKKSGGRNNEGHRTVRNVGGGHKRRYRIIDFSRDKYNVTGEVVTIEYDPNRTSRIALVQYEDGEKRYIIAPQGLKVGRKIVSGESVAPEVGNALLLKNMPLGTIVHNIELTPGKGAQLARSAGTYAQVLAKSGKYVTLKMPSGESRLILADCMATVGSVSNPEHMNTRLGKAGRKRWLGRRPRVRGVAMNPVDHPMGGGEGRASGGHPRSRNGLLAKGKKTRSLKKYSNQFIISKRTK